jgi:hypothetical protein
MFKILQNILISGLLFVFTGNYLELPAAIGLLSGTGSTCCKGSGKCCCDSNKKPDNTRQNTKQDDSCSVACAGCCHHSSVSLPQLTREFYPKTIFNSEHFFSVNLFHPLSHSLYSLLLARDMFRPPTA